MKNFKCAFLLIFGLIATSSFAQTKTLNEGMITMEITDVSSDNEQVEAQMQMLNGTQTSYYFTKDKSLVTADMMGGMIKMKTLVNNSDEYLTMMFDAMGQKMLIKSSKAERKEMEDAQNEAVEDLEITYDKSDTKEILGYKCHKAMITGQSDAEMEFSMYVCPEIKANNRLIQGLSAFELAGFPLEYTINTDQMSMTTTAKVLESKVPAGIFELNTAGYQEMSFDDFMNQMQGMGGMGF